MALKDKEPTLSQEEIDGFAAMSEEDRRLLIKVQAKLKGWVLRNKNKKRLLEEAQQAGGAYSIFELPTSEKLHEVVVCTLGSTSLMGAGSLYIFDKHLAYHNPGGGFSFFGTLKEVKMLYSFSELKDVRVKEEYVTAPGVVVTLKDGTEHWWGGMMFPTSVCESITKVWKGKSESTAAMALQARSQAALTAASKHTGKIASLEGEVESLTDEVTKLKADLGDERAAGEEARTKLAASAVALAAETEGRTAERNAAEKAAAAAAAAIAELKSEMGNLNERIARSEMDAAEQKSGRLRAEDHAASLANDLASERDRLRVAAEEAARQSAEASRRFNEYKEGADRRHAEVTARCEEARAGRDEATRQLEAAQLAYATLEKDTANVISDLRLEAEKAGWALETARAAANTAQTALEREREAYETKWPFNKIAEQRKKKTMTKESIETLRADKDNAEREVLTLSARLEEAKKQAETALAELASLKESREKESQRVESEIAERQEANRLRAVAESAAVSAREAEKYSRETAASEAHAAKEAVQREEAMRRELERVQAQLAAKEAAFTQLQSEYTSDSVATTATTSSLEAKLEEKEAALSEATLQNSTLRAELAALARQQERLAEAADRARDDAEAARGAAKEGSAEYKAAVAAMTAAEREAAAARAAEAMAREFSNRTQSDITDVVARESAAREDLTELRVAHERLQQEFRDKTASAVEKQAKAEATLMEERHKAEMANKAASNRIASLERAQLEAQHNIRSLTDSLERQKQETYYLYTNYAQIASQLEDTKVQLEREQEEIVRMHQGFAQQKMAIAGAAGAGLGVGGMGMGMGAGMMNGGGMGVGAQNRWQHKPSLALPGSAMAGANGMGGGVNGKPPLYPGAVLPGSQGAGGLPTPESLIPSILAAGSGMPDMPTTPTAQVSTHLPTITEVNP